MTLETFSDRMRRSDLFWKRFDNVWFYGIAIGGGIVIGYLLAKVIG